MPGDRVLAIAAPYAAAVIEHMGLAVTRVDADDPGIGGREFDLVVCEGAVGRAPESWRRAVASGGRLGLVERNGPVGKACLYVRGEGGIGRRDLFDATPPVLAGFAVQHGFAL